MTLQEDKFTTRWHNYTGLKGFLRYCIPFVLAGVFLCPVILTILNPNIWRQVAQSNWQRSILPMMVIGLLFSVLPAFAIALAIWWRNIRKFKYLTTGQQRFVPVEHRTWVASDAHWHRIISIFFMLSVLIAVLSFGLVLGHNAPSHYAYPFFSAVLYICVYTAYSWLTSWYYSRHDGAKTIHWSFKILFIFLMVIEIVSCLWVYISLMRNG